MQQKQQKNKASKKKKKKTKILVTQNKELFKNNLKRMKQNENLNDSK